jgi:hypothetical protein
MINKYTIKLINAGHYEYRGFEIRCLGYYPPERSIVWEAYDEFNCGFAHAHTLREVRIAIDDVLAKEEGNI